MAEARQPVRLERHDNGGACRCPSRPPRAAASIAFYQTNPFRVARCGTKLDPRAYLTAERPRSGSSMSVGDGIAVSCAPYRSTHHDD